VCVFCFQASYPADISAPVFSGTSAFSLRLMPVVSAPLVMTLRDSDIPMNVPITFRNKQPFPHGKRSYTLRTGRTLALAPFLTVTVNAG
jgi:hypothetical protein